MIMKWRDIVLLLVPPVFLKVKKKLVVKKSFIAKPIPKIKRNSDKMIVIGNGPSFNQTYDLYKETLCSTECTMVNESCLTPYYEIIRPVAYLLVDPVYFDEQNNPHYQQTRISVVNALINKTKWKMNIIMPKCAKHCTAVAKFRENVNLQVLFYEDNHILPTNKSIYEAWDMNLVIPPTQTVMNTAVWISIYWGYLETYLVGVDTSFIKDIYVGQKDNILYTKDTHYFNNDEVYDFELEPEKHGRKFGMDMEQLLRSVHTMFYEYKRLQEYSKWKNVKIYNASEYSMIDCFARKKLK